MVSEKDRERRFWRLSLFFLLASPLTWYVLVITHYSFSFSPFVFGVFCFLSIPLTLLVDAVLIKLFDTTSALRFWVVKPTDEVRHLVSLPEQDGAVLFEDLLQKTNLQRIVGMIQARLGELGFENSVTTEATGISAITFRKAKRDPILSFIDHAFFGEAQVRMFGRAVEVNVRTTFGDTILLETGESARIRALGDYLALKSPRFTYQSVPLTIYCGVNLAFLTSIIAMVPYLHRVVGNQVLSCLAAGAAGMILAALVQMQRKKEHLFGYRLAFAGLYLAAVPFAALLVSLVATTLPL